ncbi:hypothetical protein [Runella salmonicolor]|uniref:Uncharacterized protein n=1 Tax=Runella salmonicolor TaxID=2950278 RepID=A0ABT1FK15_9BACT|nr:hypothetical protein [Runella salmonicolor]MCP1382111.1 hypothetical protein [Runella salmonicolor]
MSQFDFPRINFYGQAFINPATANNNLLFPLLTYDPIEVKAILPPRIYLSSDLLLLHKLGGLPVPEDSPVNHDESTHPYIEILPIDTPEKYKTWAKTPLGNFSLDKPYHELYQLVKTKRTQQPLTGNLPAGWNYYGGMEFGFENVKVGSIAVPVSETENQHFTSNDPDCPADVAAILGSTIDLKNDRGRNSAVMIDILPTLAFYSQVFCDAFHVQKNGLSLLKGTPKKASLRFFNKERILNQEGVFGASGTFFSVIPVENLTNGVHSPIFSFFQKYQPKTTRVKGVFIQYTLFEVKEDRTIDYITSGEKANPATATLTGCITPWYEDDMMSIAMGRQLLPEMPFFNQKKLASFVCRIDTKRKVVALDMSGSIPEQLVQEHPTPVYETYPLGELTLKLLEDDNQETSLGTFHLSPRYFDHNRLLINGGLIEVSFKDKDFLTDERLKKGTLLLYGPSKSSEDSPETAVLLMKESPFMVASDQAGLYADQGQKEEAYRCYDLQKEPCQVRVYQRGKPFIGEFPLTIMELKMTGVSASASVKPFLITHHFRDKQTLTFPTEQAANAMYVFYPTPPPVISEDLVSEIQRTGFFVSLRVLPKKEFGKYLDPAHIDYPTPATFEVLYKELLQVSDLIFPMSSLITPFTEAYFKKGGAFIKQRMAPENWANATYMPSSRDMSMAQWLLFCKWLKDNK